MTKLLATAAVLVAMTASAWAEITCSRLGCWETGVRIRLVSNRQERTVTSRDGKGTVTLMNPGVYVSDTPGQRWRGNTNNGQPRRKTAR
jgi:hypothetical protein